MSDVEGFYEIEQLAGELASATPRVLEQSEMALKRTGNEVKSRWRSKAARTGLAAYAKSIDYDVRVNEAFGGASVEVEVGPNPGKRQGRFGLVEAGGGKVRSSPQHAGRDALYESQEDFVRGMAIVAVEAVLRDGS